MYNSFDLANYSKKQADKYVDSIPTKLLKRISDGPEKVARRIRKKALKIIINGIDINTNKGLSVFNFLPISLLEKEGVDMALSFLEVLGLTGEYVDIMIVEKIYLDAIADIDNAIEFGNEEYALGITKKIDLLLSMGERNQYYSQTSEFYDMMGRELERRGKLNEAIISYNKMAELGDKDGYLLAALVYKNLGKYNEAIKSLGEGFESTGDLIYLKELISTYIMAGDIKLARETHEDLLLLNDIKYGTQIESFKKVSELKERAEVNFTQDGLLGNYDFISENKLFAGGNDILVKQKEQDEILPFIIYTGEIKNDEDLKDLDIFLTKYYFEGYLYPIEGLKNLVSSASKYIEENIENINFDIGAFVKMGLQNLNESQKEELIDLMARRLYLSQIDIISLGNDRFLSFYLDELKGPLFTDLDGKLYLAKSETLAINLLETTENTDEIDKLKSSNGGFGFDVIRKYFYEYFEDPDNEEDLVEDAGFQIQSLYKHAMELIDMISTNYYHPKYYKIYRDKLSQLLAFLSIKTDGDVDENDFQKLEKLKNNFNYVNGFSQGLIDLYESFVLQMEERYGVYITRTLQGVAGSYEYDDCEGVDEKKSIEMKESGMMNLPTVLKKNPELAMLFWIEKIISDNVPTTEYNGLANLIEYYSLNQEEKITDEQLLTLSLFLFEINEYFAIEYVFSFKNLLKYPQIIYKLLESVMKSNDREKELSYLNEKVKKDLGEKSFLEFVEKEFKNLEAMGEDLPAEYDEYMMLSLGDITILKGEGYEKAETYLIRAIEKYLSVEAMFMLGALYEEGNDYETALNIYKRALYMNQHNVETYRNVISILIILKRFEEAQKYIDSGISLGYDLDQFIFANFVWQGKIKEAIDQCFTILQKGVTPHDIPGGTHDAFFTAMESLLEDEEESDEYKKMKIQICYIFAVLNPNDDLLDVSDDFLAHWDYIFEYSKGLVGKKLYDYVVSVIGGIMGENHIKEIVASYDEMLDDEKALNLIFIHAVNTFKALSNTYSQLGDDMENSKDASDDISENILNLEILSKKIIEFLEIVLQLLEKFPDSKDYVTKWKQNFYFIVPGVEIMDEEKYGSPNIH